MAFLSGVSFGEMVLVAVIAILVFGHRLPQVAGKIMRHVALLRRQMDDFRRETGIDREFRDMQDTMRDVTREATLDPNPAPPPTPPRYAPGPPPTTSSTASLADADRREPPALGEESPSAEPGVEPDAATSGEDAAPPRDPAAG